MALSATLQLVNGEVPLQAFWDAVDELDRRTSFRVRAEDFGAVGDGVTNDTAAIDAALDALEAAGGGYLHFGRGTFVANINPAANGRLKIRGVLGERDGTVLRAPTAGTFAISQTLDREFSVRGITFDGTVGGVTRRGCGIYFENAAPQSHVVDCRFQNCLIGYARQSAFYGLIDQCRFQSNDLCIFAGTRKAGTETLTGLIDGAGGAQSVVLPTPNNVNGHAGNFAVTNTHIQQSRIGVAVLPTSSIVPHVRFDKVTIEGNADAGIVATKLNATFDDCWTESNSDGVATTFTLDGRAMPRGTLVLVDGQYLPVEGAPAEADDGGSTIRWIAGQLSGCKTSARGEVYLDRAALVGSSTNIFDTSAGGAIAGGVAYADVISRPNILLSAPMPLIGDGRGFWARIPMPRGRIWQAQPAGGQVRVATDFTDATTFGTTRLVNWFPATRTFGVAGGFWDAAATVHQQVDATGAAAGFRLADPLNPNVPAGYLAMMIALKVDQPVYQMFLNSSGAIGGSAPGNFVGNNKWACYGACGFKEAVGEIQAILNVTGDGVNPLTVQFGAFQYALFDTREAAIKWFESGLLYMAEA